MAADVREMVKGESPLEDGKNDTQRADLAGLGGYRYCPHCATGLVVSDREDVPRLACPSCGFIYYNNPVPAAGAIILRDNHILFVRRKFEPRVGKWSLPAGFMEYNESAAECAVRELREETGLTGRVKDIVGVYAAGDDPRSRVVLIVYHMEVIGGAERPGDDAAEIGYFAKGNYPPFAWSSHDQALHDFFVRRRGNEK
jgi:8-oxo-dGTP diphosphatase